MDNSKLKKVWISDPAFSFYQHPDQYCFNTDSVCLAQFVQVKKGETILEIGCNNGCILRYLDQYDVKELIGVEILEDSAALAKLNAQTFFQHPCIIIQKDIKQLEHSLVDVIVCNPPYFPLHQSKERIQASLKDLGRVEYNLNVIDAIEQARRLLKSHGRLYLVHRPQRLQEILCALKQNHFGLGRMKFLIDERDQTVKNILLEGILEANPESSIEEPFLIDKNGKLKNMYEK